MALAGALGKGWDGWLDGWQWKLPTAKLLAEIRRTDEEVAKLVTWLAAEERGEPEGGELLAGIVWEVRSAE